jgi:hypothetical protein
MKKIIKSLNKITFLFFACSMLMINMGCEKEKNAPSSAYTWSATIDGVNYNYSMPSFPATDGGTVLFQTQNTGQGTSTSAVVLGDEGGFPQITIGSGSFPLSVGTFVLNAASASTNSAFNISLSANPSNPLYYSSLFGNSQITLNITTLGNVGGFVEGTFSGTVGKQLSSPPFTISYINVSGNFKAYRER